MSPTKRLKCKPGLPMRWLTGWAKIAEEDFMKSSLKKANAAWKHPFALFLDSSFFLPAMKKS